MKLAWLTVLLTAALLGVAWVQLQNLRSQMRANLLYRIHKDFLEWLRRHEPVRKWVFEGAPEGMLAEKYEAWEVDDFLAFLDAIWSFGKRRLVDAAIASDLFSAVLIGPYEANAFELQRVISALRSAEGKPDLHCGVESLYLELKRWKPMPVAQHRHRPFPARLAFLLNNPIRRYLDPPSKVLDRLAITPGEVALDLGCGPGFYTVEIASRVWRTIGVDISDEMLAKARRAATKASVSVEFLLTNGDRIPVEDASVDLILLNHVFHELEHPDRVLGEIRRTLKARGRVAILERTREGRLGRILPGPPVMRVSEILEPLTKAGFGLTRVEAIGSRSLFIAARSGEG